VRCNTELVLLEWRAKYSGTFVNESVPLRSAPLEEDNSRIKDHICTKYSYVNAGLRNAQYGTVNIITHDVAVVVA